jgi:acyl-CoA thioester hydrolase
MPMLNHKTTYRVIYGDTDKMGVVYHANYLRWFEMGRSEMFRHLGLPYTEIENRGILLPVAEAYCKYLYPAKYDDMLVIEASFDKGLYAGIKFNYSITRESDGKELVTGFTKHACITPGGKVVRPPRFLMDIVKQHQDES